MTADGGSSNPRSHSQAFQRLVDHSDDNVGLLAYALYKHSLQQRALGGHKLPLPEERVIVDNDRELYRSNAERRLQKFGEALVEDEKPAIVEAARQIQLDQSTADIIAQINSRTSFWLALGINLLAWICTIVLTVLILMSPRLAAVGEALRNLIFGAG